MNTADFQAFSAALKVDVTHQSGQDIDPDF